jgi:uncharacterized iron-regulated membrane protein
MIKRALLLLTMAGIYVWIKRTVEAAAPDKKEDHTAAAEWANEGGANSPASV